MNRIHPSPNQQPYRNPSYPSSQSPTLSINPITNNNHYSSPKNIRHSDPKSNIKNIIEFLTLPCCGENVFKLSKQNHQNTPIPILYIMPCGHNMCEKCICTILEYKTDNTISCSHRDCTRNFTFQQAQQLFIRNQLVCSFFKRLLEIKHWANSPDKLPLTLNKQNKNQRQTLHGNYRQEDTIKKVHFISPSFQNDKKDNKSSDDSSEQQVFNQCINIFCKKPTPGFFCSQKCEQLIIKLDQIVPTNIRIINNQLCSN